MANVLIESQTMTDIANAIREKSGTDVKMKPAEMPQAVRDIKSEDTGVGSRQWWLDVFSQKKNFANMFEGCSITTIPQLDTSKGTNFAYMFKDCSNLTTIPQLDTSKGTNFAYMFHACSKLTTIPQLDTSKGTNFLYMFNACSNLTTISQLDTSKGTQIVGMFAGCYKLTTISFVLFSIKKSISFQQSGNLTDESIQSIIDGLADLTGQTAQTITFHSTVTMKLTNEQKQTIVNKGWKYQ